MTSGFYGEASVRNRSKAAVCGANLGQIAKAMLAYASDNDDRVPPFVTSSSTPVGGRTEAVSGALAWVQALSAYGASRDIFRCPADSRFGRDARDYPGDSFRYTSYFVHNYVGTGFPMKGGGTTYLISQIDDTSARVYAGDKALAEKEKLGGGKWRPKFYGAHGYYDNEVAMDGHVVYGRIDRTDGKWPVTY